MTHQDTYITRIKNHLEELNASMEALETKAREIRADARDKYQLEMADLREQASLATAKLEELKLAGTDSWDKLVAEMEKLRDAFSHSFNYFKSQL